MASAYQTQLSSGNSQNVDVNKTKYGKLSFVGSISFVTGMMVNGIVSPITLKIEFIDSKTLTTGEYGE